MTQQQLQPSSVKAVQEAILEARTAKTPLEIIGGGTKRSFGRPVLAPTVLSTSALSGIVEYLPHELILVTKPGTPMREITQTLADKGQELAFEPPQWADHATIGGVVATNLSGPRRLRAGAARDHLLGFEAVSGLGEVFHGGGKVVKNVTGYDVSKLMAGSFGTLAVMTELVLKVLPAAATQATVAVGGMDAQAATEAFDQINRTHHEPTAMAYLPKGTALPASCGPVAQMAAAQSLTLFRLEGPAPSVHARVEALLPLLGGQGGQVRSLAEGESKALWQTLNELTPLPVEGTARLWRFSVPPTAGPSLLNKLTTTHEGKGFVTWGGALVWVVLPANVDEGVLHNMASEAGGNARMVNSGSMVDHPQFQAVTPLTSGLHKLNQNLKAAFDPDRILNPGRLYPDL